MRVYALDRNSCYADKFMTFVISYSQETLATCKEPSYDLW